ncbi:hypothetical protein EVAR_95114_1 [Eumeta japonica]|uniref:Uncharacterized protein n=1 Tax=Eumeta variegata TaxID=151549 RepID=A0A4C2AB97_EUMVA|nr:hypothetical protein EVAR_95114_1 [Eumeta japonica]
MITTIFITCSREQEQSRRALESRRYTRNLIEVTRAFRADGGAERERNRSTRTGHGPYNPARSASTCRRTFDDAGAASIRPRVTIIDSRVVALTGTFIQSRQPPGRATRRADETGFRSNPTVISSVIEFPGRTGHRMKSRDRKEAGQERDQDLESGVS